MYVYIYIHTYIGCRPDGGRAADGVREGPGAGGAEEAIIIYNNYTIIIIIVLYYYIYIYIYTY